MSGAQARDVTPPTPCMCMTDMIKIKSRAQCFPSPIVPPQIIEDVRIAERGMGQDETEPQTIRMKEEREEETLQGMGQGGGRGAR